MVKWAVKGRRSVFQRNVIGDNRAEFHGNYCKLKLTFRYTSAWCFSFDFFYPYLRHHFVLGRRLIYGFPNAARQKGHIFDQEQRIRTFSTRWDESVLILFLREVTRKRCFPTRMHKLRIEISVLNIKLLHWELFSFHVRRHVDMYTIFHHFIQV